MKSHILFIMGLTIVLFVCFPESESAQPPSFACDWSNSETKSLKFCQTNFSIDERVRHLVSHLTIDEKVSQLIDNASGIPRLGIPAYKWWLEALHGVAPGGRLGVSFKGQVTIPNVTSFPQVILMS